MKKSSITCNRKVFLKILGTLLPGLSTNDIATQTMSFIFKDEYIWSFNNEVAVSHPLPEGMKKILGAVPAKPLFNLISKLNMETLSFTLSEDMLYISGSKATAGLLFETEVKLPIDKIPVPDSDDNWIPFSSEAVEGLSLAALSVDRRISSGSILGCISINEQQIVGCNNYQFTIITFRKKLGGFTPTLIPGKAISDIVRFSPTGILHTKGWIHFINTDNAILSCITIEGKYPDITDFLSIKGTSVEMPENLSETLIRAEIFTSEKQGEDDKVTLILDKNGVLTVSSQNEFGWIKEKHHLTQQGLSFQFEINPIVLINALKLNRTLLISDNMVLLKGKGFKHGISLT